MSLARHLLLTSKVVDGELQGGQLAVHEFCQVLKLAPLHRCLPDQFASSLSKLGIAAVSTQLRQRRHQLRILPNRQAHPLLGQGDVHAEELVHRRNMGSAKSLCRGFCPKAQLLSDRLVQETPGGWSNHLIDDVLDGPLEPFREILHSLSEAVILEENHNCLIVAVCPKQKPSGFSSRGDLHRLLRARLRCRPPRGDHIWPLRIW
mmetsp:Transcript_56074/g.121267  ORF Transcript_56074/g.121267 Transcript_56074/m.121267 type:complete len:205 (-) Transcript_56074:1165-1779(-)